MELFKSILRRKDVPEDVKRDIRRGIAEREEIEKALRESEEKYRELSIIDDLTQLNNSRYFNHQLGLEIDRATRYEQPLTLLLMDLDNFKIFNDTYGHVEGDQVLSRIGQVIKRCLRDIDSAYRYGGEEFTVILPMTVGEKGVMIAERIQRELRKETFAPIFGQNMHVTLSIGVAQFQLLENTKTFVQRTDKFMYQAKKSGRNKICSEN